MYMCLIRLTSVANTPAKSYPNIGWNGTDRINGAWRCSVVAFSLRVVSFSLRASHIIRAHTKAHTPHICRQIYRQTCSVMAASTRRGQPESVFELVGRGCADVHIKIEYGVEYHA